MKSLTRLPNITAGSNSSTMIVPTMPIAELFPRGLLLRFDLFSGSPWSFFKTSNALHQTIDHLTHPLPPAHETRARRRKSNTARPSADDKRSGSSRLRPASPAPRLSINEEPIPINRSGAKTPTLRESSFHSEVGHHSDISITIMKDTPPKETRHHKKIDRGATPSPNLSPEHELIIQLVAQVNESKEEIKSLHRTVEKQAEIIQQLQRHVETLRSDMFQMQSFHSRVVQKSKKKKSTTPRQSTKDSPTS